MWAIRVDGLIAGEPEYEGTGRHLWCYETRTRIKTAQRRSSRLKFHPSLYGMGSGGRKWIKPLIFNYHSFETIDSG